MILFYGRNKCGYLSKESYGSDVSAGISAVIGIHTVGTNTPSGVQKIEGLNEGCDFILQKQRLFLKPSREIPFFPVRTESFL